MGRHEMTVGISSCSITSKAVLEIELLVISILGMLKITLLAVSDHRSKHEMILVCKRPGLSVEESAFATRVVSDKESASRWP